MSEGCSVRSDQTRLATEVLDASSEGCQGEQTASCQATGPLHSVMTMMAAAVLCPSMRPGVEDLYLPERARIRDLLPPKG